MKKHHSAHTHRQLEPTVDPNGSPGAAVLQVLSESPPHDAVNDDSVPPWVKRRVLLLNATYEPLTALPVRRAVVPVSYTHLTLPTICSV